MFEIANIKNNKYYDKIQLRKNVKKFLKKAHFDRFFNELWPYRDRHDYHGLASGGIGWGIAASVGVQLAHPDRISKRVVALGWFDALGETRLLHDIVFVFASFVCNFMQLCR